jgi:hypothetical protein
MKKQLSLLLATLFIVIASFSQYSSSAIKQGVGEVKKDTTENTLQEVVVSAKPYPQFKLVGDYKQPAWTLVRKFPSTRVYVMTPPGTIMYEKWFDVRTPKDGSPAEVRMRDEFAFGLGKRLELDFYMHTVYKNNDALSTFGFRGFSWEVRYALADWGKIPGNPTLYFEHKLLNQKRQGIEPKILLGDRIGKKGIWGLNLILEADVAKLRKDQNREWAYTASYGNIVNDDLTMGISHMFRYNDVKQTQEWYVGPLVQYRFNGHGYLNVEHMPGLNDAAKKSRTIIIFGWRF